MMKIGIYIQILSLLSGIRTLVLGADEFTVSVSESCYNDNQDVKLTVQYTGSGSPTVVQWKFSKMTNVAETLDVVISLCLAASGADAAFPEDRMSYACDTGNNQYNVTIRNFNETTDAGVWEAALSVGGTSTNFRNVTVTKCPAPAPAPAAPGSGGGCSAGCIGGIVGGVVGAGVAAGGVVGGVAYKKSRAKKRKNTEKTEAEPETHAGNPRSNRTSPSVEMEAEHNKHGPMKRPQPPPPGANIHGREGSDSAVSRQDVELLESGSHLTKRPIPAITPGHDSKGRGLSANFDDKDHPLEYIETPAQRKGALGALDEGTGEESQKVKKKKKKSNKNRDLNVDEE